MGSDRQVTPHGQPREGSREGREVREIQAGEPCQGVEEEGEHHQGRDPYHHQGRERREGKGQGNPREGRDQPRVMPNEKEE